MAMILAAALLSLHTESATELMDQWMSKTDKPWVDGFISYYDDGVMRTVAVNKGYIKSAEEYDAWLLENGYLGAISGMRYGDIGREVYIVMRGEVSGPYIIIDCSARHDYDRNVHTLGRIGEVSKRVAQENNMNGPISGTIIFNEQKIMIADKKMEEFMK